MIRADVLSAALTGLCVVSVTVLAVVGAPIPDVLVTVALVSAGAGAGAGIPRSSKAAA